MGRKRIEITPEAEARIVALLARGASAETVAHELGISPATAKRRIRELRGKVPAARDAMIARARAAPPPAPPPDGGEFEIEVPPDATIAQIDHWIGVATQKAEAAAACDDADAHATYMRMVITLLEARRKAAPIPKPDPNDSPDMLEEAAKVRERWHKLADALVRVSNSPIAATIARILAEKRKAA